MGYSQLTIGYTRQTQSGIGYLLETVVNTSGSTPSEIYDCLIVNKGGVSTDESIARVAVYNEMPSGVSALPLLPSTIRVFSAPSLSSLPGGTPQVGDIIRITQTPPPPIWQFIYGAAPSDREYEVVTVNSPTEVIVDQDFPAFGRSLTFEVERASVVELSGVSDGLANRDYTGLVGTLFRTRAHGDFWEDYEDAQNKYDSLRAEAQSLVDAYNATEFTGTTEETYV